jgi:hypothetical protein
MQLSSGEFNVGIVLRDGEVVYLSPSTAYKAATQICGTGAIAQRLNVARNRMSPEAFEVMVTALLGKGQ